MNRRVLCLELTAKRAALFWIIAQSQVDSPLFTVSTSNTCPGMDHWAASLCCHDNKRLPINMAVNHSVIVMSSSINNCCSKRDIPIIAGLPRTAAERFIARSKKYTWWWPLYSMHAHGRPVSQSSGVNQVRSGLCWSYSRIKTSTCVQINTI